MKVEAVMTRNVVTLSPSETVLQASLKMSEKNISGAPVVDVDGKLIGIFSEADVLRSLKTTKKKLHMVYPSLSSISVTFQEQTIEKEALEAYREVENSKVRDLMKTQVETVGPDDDLKDAIKKMVARSINRLPVIDSDRKVIGIITRGDILKGIALESSNNKNH